MVRSPDSGCSKPMIILNSVDFPEPFPPTIPAERDQSTQRVGKKNSLTVWRGWGTEAVRQYEAGIIDTLVHGGQWLAGHNLALWKDSCSATVHTYNTAWRDGEAEVVNEHSVAVGLAQVLRFNDDVTQSWADRNGDRLQS